MPREWTRGAREAVFPYRVNIRLDAVGFIKYCQVWCRGHWDIISKDIMGFEYEAEAVRIQELFGASEIVNTSAATNKMLIEEMPIVERELEKEIGSDQD